MPTTYLDQFFVIDPFSPPPAGTVMVVQKYNLIDQIDDNDIDQFDNDSVNGQDVTDSWPGDTVTVNVPGTGNVTYTGITLYLADGSRVFTPTDGQVLQQGTLVSTTFVSSQGPLNVPGELGPPCFTRDTLIETPDGPTPVQDLSAGDLVLTVDNGAKPLLWVGKTRVPAVGKTAPIRFAAGVLGLDRETLVSPQHRMLIDDWRAEYFYGYPEILIAAHCLVNGTSVTRVEGGDVTYYHLLFDQHEIVTANGARSESYYPGHALSQSDRDTCRELFDLFPELDRADLGMLKTARPVIRPRDAQVIG